jgi:hypothetical protein
MVGDMLDNNLKTKSNAPYKALVVMSHKCPRLIAAFAAALRICLGASRGAIVALALLMG